MMPTTRLVIIIMMTIVVRTMTMVFADHADCDDNNDDDNINDDFITFMIRMFEMMITYIDRGHRESEEREVNRESVPPSAYLIIPASVESLSHIIPVRLATQRNTLNHYPAPS